MKKEFTTVIDESANNVEKFYVSAGRIGSQLEIAPSELKKVVNYTMAAITK